MFKVVRDLVKLQVLVLCDASCAANITLFLDPGPVEYEEQQQAEFAKALIAGGWKITLARQLCPHHFRREDAAALMAMQTSGFKN